MNTCKYINRLIVPLIACLTLVACGKGSSPVADATATNASVTNPSTNDTRPAPPALPTPAAPKIPARGYILLDFASGQILAEDNDTERLEPASLTKLMTAYAVFDALRVGSLHLTDNVTISEHAWREGGAATEGSTSFLPVKSQVPVEKLLRGMIVQSGNDASIALAERVGGTEDAFAQLMNAYAKRLGMTGTHFENATGLPHPDHFTTAHDIALLATALIRDFPQYYHYFSEKEFTFNGITQHNRNGLLGHDPSVDGLKTGHTESAGYCLVTSAKRNGMRLVSVVMGTPSVHAREEASSALLNYGFNYFESKQVFAKAQPLASPRVWKGARNKVPLSVAHDVYVAVPRGQADRLQSQVQVPASIVAPIAQAQRLGRVTVTLDGKTLVAAPLFAQTAVPEAGLFGRLYDSVRMKFD